MNIEELQISLRASISKAINDGAANPGEIIAMLEVEKFNFQMWIRSKAAQATHGASIIPISKLNTPLNG